MALVTFYQIFRVISNDTLEFIYKTKVGDLTFDAGAPVKRGVIIAGLDFFQYIGNNMEVDDEADGSKVIKKVYVS